MKKRVKTDISFADAEFVSFQMSEIGELKVYVKSWQDLEIKITLSSVLYFSYSEGDVLENLYEINASPLIDKVLSKHFVNIPEDHTYKLYQLLDIDDHPIVEVVAEKIEVVKACTP